MATVPKLVKESRSRNGGWWRKAVGYGVLLAVLLALAVTGGRGSASPALGPLAAPAGHGLAVRLPVARAGADNLCGVAAGLVCSQVVVPLDRTGAVPGTIALHVEELPTDGVVRGTIFLIAGGPGQGSAHTFGLGTAGRLALPLSLPGLQPRHLRRPRHRRVGAHRLPCAAGRDDRGGEPRGRRGVRAVARCGRQLLQHRRRTRRTSRRFGSRSASTRSRFTASRTARSCRWRMRLHTPTMSRGCCSTRCSRRSCPTRTRRACSAPCPARLRRTAQSAATAAAFASDVVAVANKLGVKPLKGKVLRPSGGTTSKSIDGQEALSIVLDADLSPGEAAELPAVVPRRAARQHTAAIAPRGPA